MTEVENAKQQSNKIDLTPESDGGVLKEIKKEGTGEETPGPGDTVFVHYVGTLEDGTKFDSSRDRDDKFSFELGKGSVIPAWDLGVGTMKRGEVAVLTCAAKYAYGEAGSPPKIQPNATLTFEVELFDWKGEDISTDKDGSIIRNVLVKGDGYLKPNDGAIVKIHITGWHNEKKFQDEDKEFELGEGSEKGIISGIEFSLKKSKKQEKSRLKIGAKHAYGSEGNKEFGIPPNADLVYEVVVNSFEKAKESWECESAEKIEQSEIFKTKGTKFFKESKYSLAILNYKKIVEFLSYDGDFEGEEAVKRKAILLAANLNLAMCHLKLNQNSDASDACDMALTLDPNNEKALFRKAESWLNRKNFGEAAKSFESVMALYPENTMAKKKAAQARQMIKSQTDKEKKTYAGMFEKFAKEDAKN